MSCFVPHYPTLSLYNDHPVFTPSHVSQATETPFPPTITQCEPLALVFDPPAPFLTHQHPFPTPAPHFRPTSTGFRPQSRVLTCFEPPAPIFDHPGPFPSTSTRFLATPTWLPHPYVRTMTSYGSRISTFLEIREWYDVTFPTLAINRTSKQVVCHPPSSIVQLLAPVLFSALGIPS